MIRWARAFTVFEPQAVFEGMDVAREADDAEPPINAPRSV